MNGLICNLKRTRLPGGGRNGITSKQTPGKRLRFWCLETIQNNLQERRTSPVWLKGSSADPPVSSPLLCHVHPVCPVRDSCIKQWGLWLSVGRVSIPYAIASKQVFWVLQCDLREQKGQKRGETSSVICGSTVACLSRRNSCLTWGQDDVKMHKLEDCWIISVMFVGI